MKVIRFLIAATFVLGCWSLALAVSDGNYSPKRQHCSGHANNTTTPDYYEDGCLNYAFSVSDFGGHEYFGWGSPQTKVHDTGPVPDVIPFGTGSSLHQIAFWTDPGPDQGGCQYTRIDLNTNASTTEPCPWFDPTKPNYYGPDPDPKPSSGLRLYNGADDNLAGGEHDSSAQMNNGPSDGGAIQVNLDPASVSAWAASVMAAAQGGGSGAHGLLAHPLPLADAGMGACADGLCISIQTTQRSQAYPTSDPLIGPRDHGVADQGGFHFDPQSCEGGRDTPSDCGGKNLVDWNRENGDPTVDPGVQIYEDPDAQSSPLPPYPHPAIYVGTCGVVLGGGPAQFPPGPNVNDHGQLVIDTGCHAGGILY